MHLKYIKTLIFLKCQHLVIQHIHYNLVVNDGELLRLKRCSLSLAASARALTIQLLKELSWLSCWCRSWFGTGIKQDSGWPCSHYRQIQECHVGSGRQSSLHSCPTQTAFIHVRGYLTPKTHKTKCVTDLDTMVTEAIVRAACQLGF